MNNTISETRTLTINLLEIACRKYVSLYFEGKDPNEIITHTITWSDNENRAWCDLASKLVGYKLLPLENQPPNTYSFPRWVYPCRTLCSLYCQMQAIQIALMAG